MTYGTPEAEGASSVIPTSDRGYVVGGYIAEIGKTLASNILILRIDSLGNLLWARTFEGLWFDGINSITQAADGDHVVAGSTNHWFPYSTDLLVIKIDPSGNMKWTMTYGDEAHGDTAYSEEAPLIIPSPDGEYIIGGHQWISGSNIFRLLLLNIDSSGEMVSVRMFGDMGIQFPIP